MIGVVFKVVICFDGLYIMLGLVLGKYEICVVGSEKFEVVIVGVGDSLILDLFIFNILEKVVVIGSGVC